MEFRILFQDAHLVAIDKPSGWLVHRMGRSEDKQFVLQELRNQVGRHVFPLHRLDRMTSGVLLFGFDAESTAAMQLVMESEACQKRYFAVVRGWLPEEGRIDEPLEKDGIGELQPALTTFRCLQKAEIPLAVSRYESARYSLAEVQIHTGRMHQIRRHFAHLRHPVVGDRKHGDRHHNKAWEAHFGIRGSLLMAWKMEFPHPFGGKHVCIEAGPEARFQQAMDILNFDFPLKCD